jgi:hypothetical protein
MGWTVWGSNPSRDKGFFFLHNALTSGVDAGSYPVVTGVLFLKVLSSLSMRLTTHLSVVMTKYVWSLYLHSPDAFTVWTETALFYFMRVEGGKNSL